MAEQHKPLEDEWVQDEDLAPRALRGLSHRRALMVVGLLILVVLLALLPPLLNVNRYKRQIAASIGTSLGRPVHIDSVTLTLLPMPGFTLEQFVVGEDPAFGAEPVIRAAEVRATLRVSSLWRRRVEFSRIVLDDPSVNLVHLPDGRWNLQSILVQASRMPAAPTAQKGAGASPRFPYIEATGARVNLKMGLEKMPISLTEADFALWLPQPNEWHLRLKAHPARTDAAAMDTGVLRLDGVLGRAATLAEVPVELNGEWSGAPLGALSWLVLGKDAGMRGDMTLTARVKGTMGRNGVESRLQLARVRRADFVPPRTLDADLRCSAQAAEVFHALEQVQCTWPGDGDASGLLISGDVPDLLRPSSAALRVEAKGVPVGLLLDGARVLSERIAPELQLTGGNLALQGSCCSASGAVGDGDLAVQAPAASLALGGQKPFFTQAVTGETQEGSFHVSPLALDLGGKEPAMLSVHASRAGYSLTLLGSGLRSRMDTLARALPQFGDGLDELLGPATDGDVPVRLDLAAARTWMGGQSWTGSKSSTSARSLTGATAAGRTSPRTKKVRR